MLLPSSSLSSPLLFLAVSVLTVLPRADAQQAPIDICQSTGCAQVSSLLLPCGGISNASLSQDAIYTPTAALGGCECNTVFYNALSSCLSCISSQGVNNPEIQNQQDWNTNCNSYGYNITAAPVTNSTSTAPVPGTGSSTKSGLSAGAIAGIVVGLLAIIVGAGLFVFQRKRSKRTKGSLFKPSATNNQYEPTPTVSDFNSTSYGGNTANGYPETQEYGAQHYGAYDQNNQYGGHGQYDDHNDHYTAAAVAAAAGAAAAHHHYSDNDNNNSQYGGYNNNNNNNYTNDQIPLQDLESAYMPPPNSTGHTASAAALASGAAAGQLASPRPSDSFPQSLRNKKPTAWGGKATGGGGTTGAAYGEKTDYTSEDDHDDFSPPQNHYGVPPRAMTPPRAAGMQSYRDDFSRGSFDRSSPRHSGSDRGSVQLTSGGLANTGLSRGGNTYGDDEYEEHDVVGRQSGLAVDTTPGGGFTRNFDTYGISRSDSPRRDRAAELFAAETTRK